MGKLLVAEDELPVRLFLKEALRIGGHEVVTVENGMEGVRLLLAGESFDLILSDIRMPCVDGARFAEIVRDMGLVMPMLMLTASPQSALDIWERGLVQGVLKKPVDLSELMSEIDVALAMRLERRTTPRMSFSIPVTLQTDDGSEFDGLLADISAGGIRINWDTPVDKQTIGQFKRLLVNDINLPIQAKHSVGEPQTGFTFQIRTRQEVAQLGKLLSNIS